MSVIISDVEELDRASNSTRQTDHCVYVVDIQTERLS